MKKIFNHFFIDGMNGMTTGIFCTLIIGTLLQQIGAIIPGAIGTDISTLGRLAASFMGAGIGCSMAVKFGCSQLVTLSAAFAGLIGAHAGEILSGSLLCSDTLILSGGGEPLGAFLAAVAAIEIGCLVSEKTPFDLLLTPLISIGSGAVLGLLISPWITLLMEHIADCIKWSNGQQPFFMGVIVAVLMCIFSVLPFNPLSLAALLNLHGISAGAATVGCCACMVGFAVSGFHENQMGGILAQGFGSGMIQMANVLKRPLILLPSLFTSAILGPVSVCVLKMTNSETGAGLGTLGLVGPIGAYRSMSHDMPSAQAGIISLMLCIVLPALLAFVISEAMRKLNLIHDGDMKLDHI